MSQIEWHPKGTRLFTTGDAQDLRDLLVHIAEQGPYVKWTRYGHLLRRLLVVAESAKKMPGRITELERDAISWAIEEDGDDDAPMRHEQKYGPGFDSLFLGALRGMLTETAP